MSGQVDGLKPDKNPPADAGMWVDVQFRPFVPSNINEFCITYTHLPPQGAIHAAVLISVWLKSLPLNKSGSPVAFARA